MMTQDKRRLCIRAAVGDKSTGCRTPYFVSDVLTSLRRAGHVAYSSRLSTTPRLCFSVSISGNEFNVMQEEDDDGAWCSVSLGNKVVRVNVLREMHVPVSATHGGVEYDLSEYLYKVWSSGGYDANPVPFAAFSFEDVKYAEPDSIRAAVDLLLIKSSSVC